MLAAGTTLGWKTAASATDDPANLETLAAEAAIWGLPLVQTSRYMSLAHAAGLAWNRFYLNETLATPAMKLLGPNIDTIYGIGWLDLSRGPLVLDVPDAADRYYSIQFLDAYENVFAYVGRRETGTRAGSYVIAGPGWHGGIPAGAKRIDSRTSVVLALTRTLVKGSSDLRAARDLQEAYTLAPLSDYPAGKQAGIVGANGLGTVPALNLAGDGAAYFAELDALVRRFPPRGPEAVAYRRFAALGLGRGFAEHPPLPAAQLQAALDSALARVRACDPTEENNGWRVNYHVQKFISDPLLRAANNRFGPGAHIAEEALYFNATHDTDGTPLTGAHSYSITFPKGQLPPAKAFWSLILYGADFLLVDNPINRYTINDRTEGLAFASDGSLRILIQHEVPSDRANWLPAPAGAFRLILRTYQPDATLLSGRYLVPKIVRAP